MRTRGRGATLSDVRIAGRRRATLIEDWYAGRGAVVAAGAQPPGATPIGGPSDGAPAAPAPSTPAPTDDSTDDVENETICANPDCGHMASAHEDVAEGDNTGACTMENCACEAMVTPTDGEDAEDVPAPATPAPAPAGASSQAEGFADAAPAVGDAPDAPPEGGDGTDGGDGSGDAAPAAPGVVTDSSSGPSTGGPGDDDASEALMGPAFTIPVLVIEGIPTSDGRQIAEGALTWRAPPLPLMGLDETNDWGHDGAVICGRIDSIVRDGNTLTATGFFLADENGLRFAELVATGAIKGVSVDIGDVDSSIAVTGIDTDGFPTDISEILVQGEVMGATICPFPAFAGAYIQLDSTEPDTSIPLEQPTPEQAAAGINVLSIRECVPCSTGAVVASIAGPLAPPAEWYADPGFAELTPLTVTDDGRVFGHIAPWGECHVGIQGECVTPPHSESDYALFHQGSVVCADGSVVRTGAITMDAEHAPTAGRLTAAQARAHYDNTAARFADVRAGEDGFGIWVAGSVDPEIEDAQVRRFRGSAISGDWRWVGTSYEMVAALAVNTPGFPVVTASAHDGLVEALVAAGAPQMVALARSLSTETVETRLERIERTQRLLAPLAASGLRERYTRARGR